MNNDELKKKICEIIDSSCSFYCGSNVHMDDEQENAIADALIAAGIGDVSSEKAMRELAEAFYREKCAEYDLINYKLQKAEHRAEVAERALRIVCGNITKELWQDWHASWRTRNYYDEMIQQAKKELAGENGGKKEV